MMKRLLAWRHVAYEDLDGLAPPFRAAGYAIDYWDALFDGEEPDALSPDILVVLGAPIGVYEQEQYPFVHRQIEALRRRIEAGRPTLGICFGAQLIAAALGARVYRGDHFEFGWGPVATTNDGLKSPVGAYDGAVFHCHGDTFDLPRGAKLLAGSTHYPHQAFSYGPQLALQFHGEVTGRGLKRWFIGHSARIKSLGGLDKLARETEAQMHQLQPRLDRFVGSWLQSLS
jgi:GMP synthase (glutamine-hydrolysing)